MNNDSAIINNADGVGMSSEILNITNDVAVAEKLLGKIDEIAEIFWATKK